jgi:sortase A
MKPAGRIEKFFLVAGCVLLLIYVSARLHSYVASRVALWTFDTAEVSASPSPPADATSDAEGAKINFSLWSEKRIQQYKQALAEKFDPPLGVLSIPKLQLTVPVFEGTDDLTLNRGVGRIAGTARPGEAGNLGIAGHRDGFFRPLKDIHEGDEVDLAMAGRTLRYVVDEIEIVTPADTRVLQARARPSLTLVTCYPFYFVGDAPRRYIVHAAMADLDAAPSK